ncbi:MAG: hypothetical protein JRM85_02655 [Nitrososphaerota archaeon]|nr:hypothetical protein [Nitrososphaerota archaeon]MDG6918805.1 hypothetical protein [Nitrososphaerota archaeon]MDG6946578.1 hypothetical protein [Nitrososphaerota archaeon]MDG6947735.1 hypothetical protein [Nitrososphaerota archaeon]
MNPLLLEAAAILAISFVSNISPFFGASYTFFATLDLILIGFTPANFLAVVAFSAAGAALGKLVIYYGAFGLRRFLVGNKNVQLIGRNASKRTFYAVLFVAAFLPVLPLDDFIYIGAGATSASLSAMGGVTFGAKLLKSAVEIGIEFTILKEVIRAFTFSNVWLTIAVTAGFIAVGILIYQLDWEALAKRYLHIELDSDQLSDEETQAI